jgi:hypothetical protein
MHPVLPLGAHLALICGLALSACSPARPGTAPAPSSPATARTGDDWSSMSWEDRHDLMTWTVLPNMSPVFQKVFATPDPSLSCRTCHGANAEAVAYKMPNTLPPLDPARMPTGPVADAMKRAVVPEMTQLLGTTVGCFTCHPTQAAP